MSDYKTVSTEDLLKRSHALQAQQDALRDERNAINKELAFRDNFEARSKALKGMSPEEIARVLEMSQSVDAAGGIESAEAVDGLKG